MNYLAHASLSFNNPGILAGNMVSDFVKGKKQYDYPELIQKGIRLHRAIDTFTDQHAVTKEAKNLLKPAAGAYAGAFMDVVYDHFLALDTNQFPDDSLAAFATQVYAQLTEQQSVLPEKFVRILPYMRSQNWLYHYRDTEGIEKSFGGLARRAAYLDDASGVFALFLEQYEKLRIHYQSFFPEVKAYASAQFAVLLIQ
ncbi:MAG: ACP phosphodiesterase [Bacteroidota bacterium]